MKFEDIKVDLDELKNEKMRNFRDRIWFIKYWANFVREQRDEKWSEGQARLIDSQVKGARDFYKNLGKTEEGRKILERLMKERLKVRKERGA